LADGCGVVKFTWTHFSAIHMPSSNIKPSGRPAREADRAAAAGDDTNRRRTAPAAGWVFAAATFLSAFLLFLVQPLIARYILPWFGGGPDVWTACMLFFQIVLLAGYAYAHLGIDLVSTGRIALRTQALVHCALLLAALGALWFVVPSAAWKPTSSYDPVGRILLLLLGTVGLPYFALSATGPLLQAWFSRLDHAGNAARTYRLYALSNGGSLLALLSYPFLFEPLLTRAGQMATWSVGLMLFAPACIACAWLVARPTAAPAADVTSAKTTARAPRDRRAGRDGAAPSRPAAVSAAGGTATRIGRIALWIALPAAASTLLLAATNTLTQDIAPIPLLWVLPLSLYLLSFIVAFAGTAVYRRWVAWPAMVIGVALQCVALIFEGLGDAFPPLVRVAILSFALFACCVVCHGELVRLRPPAERLTSFYLAVAAGGAVGGFFVGVIAPLIFVTFAELRIGLFACCALALLGRWFAGPLPRRLAWAGAAWAAAVAVLLWGPWAAQVPDMSTLYQSRDFYGTLSIEWIAPRGPDEPDQLILMHGKIRHGLQLVGPKWREVPTSYYSVDSGVGFTLRNTPPTAAAPGRHVGIIGLGAGTLAAYGKPGDRFRFYELNPSVMTLATDGPFTFLRDSAAKCEVIVGDGRLSLEREPDQHFDLLVLDAFSGDAIPVHLLTAEAFDLYCRHLRPGGAIVVHVTNAYLNLEPVLARAAARMGWSALLAATNPAPGRADYANPSNWVLLSPDPTKTAAFVKAGGRQLTVRPDVPLWTDDRADLLSILK
jgi:hypothetical protein